MYKKKVETKHKQRRVVSPNRMLFAYKEFNIMRYLIVIVPIVLGCVDLALRDFNIFGSMFIGIGIFFLITQIIVFNTPPEEENIKFDWFSCIIFLVLAAIFFMNSLSNYNQSTLLSFIGFTLLVLSKTDVLIASLIANEGSPLLKKVKTIVTTKFRCALEFCGIGFFLSSLIIVFT